MVMQRMRRRVSSVALSTDLVDPSGVVRIRPEELKETPIFRDVACPLGVPGSALLFHSGASGEFMIHAAFPEIDHRPFGEVTRKVLSALLPGFAASIGALARLGDARQAVAVLLDALDDGAAVFDSSGRKQLARNLAAGQLMSEEPDKSGLETRMLQAAAAAFRSPTNETAQLLRENRTALAGGWKSSSGVSYRLRTVRLPAGSLATDESILVLIQRVSPAVPAVHDLRIRFGLTLREAQVARLLAIGRSDREIAAELNLSHHTVRHHAEAVFLKAGVTSRKALALHLSGPVTRP